MVKWVRNVLQHEDWRPKRPWGITKNGDVLEVLFHFIQGRGRNSISITKTKGHASLEHIEQGLSNIKIYTMCERDTLLVGFSEHFDGMSTLAEGATDSAGERKL